MDKLLYGALVVFVGVTLIGPVSSSIDTLITNRTDETSGEVDLASGVQSLLEILPIVIVIGVVGTALAYFGLKKGE